MKEKLEFPHLDTIFKLKLNDEDDFTSALYHQLDNSHFETLHHLMADKLIALNNNPFYTPDMIKEHLDLKRSATYINVSRDKDILKFHYDFNLFELFDFEMKILLQVYYTADGIPKNYTSHYLETDCDALLLNKFNINHFMDNSSKLEFSLFENKSDSLYTLSKSHYIDITRLNKQVVTLKYQFNTDHKVVVRHFETKDLFKKETVGYPTKGYKDINIELLLVKFINHVIAVKQEVDSSFLNFNEVDFHNPDWFKVIEKNFSDNMAGTKRVAFLDYLKLIDMIEY
jgi:hypothetical protein